MKSPWPSLMLGCLVCLTSICLVGCGDGSDPATEPPSPAAEDQPVTDAPPPTR